MTRRAGWGEKHWVVSASMLSSAQSFVVSAGAVKVLDLPAFGLFALCLTSAYFVGAMVRASTAETGLGASLGASLPRSRVMFAYALGLAAGMALVAAQLLWVGESQGVLLPASLSCASAFGGCRFACVVRTGHCWLTHYRRSRAGRYLDGWSIGSRPIRCLCCRPQVATRCGL